jgi:hypothetical protein
MNYDPDHWRKWTPQPREAPAWLKRMEYKKAEREVEEREEGLSLDAIGLVLGVGLILFALFQFACILLKNL